MTRAPEPADANADQARYWGSSAGRTWVDLQAPLDAALAPVNALLLGRAAPAPGERVLDIGCGAGETAFAIAERVGAEGRVVAVDISPPLLAYAAERTPASLASRLDFIEADAQTHPFASRRFDLLVSRFGAMFFADPIAAFSNLLRALRPGGRLHMVAWGPVEANPWFTVPRDAAIGRLGSPPPVPPTAPGPLAFSDMDYVLEILRKAGFAAVTAEAALVHLEPPGSLDEAAHLTTRVGPAARILAAFDGGPDDADAIREATAAGFAPYWNGAGVRVPAVVNLFAATAA